MAALAAGPGPLHQELRDFDSAFPSSLTCMYVISLLRCRLIVLEQTSQHAPCDYRLSAFAEHVEPIVARLSDNDKCTGYMDFSTTERKSLSVSPRWTEVPFGTLSPHIQQPHLVTEHCCANTYANLHMNVAMMRFDGAYDISILPFMHFLELKVIDEDLPAQYWSINKSPQLSLVWGQHYILN